MKILLIDVNCKNSSTGKIVYDLYTAVRNEGNDAAVCYGRGEKIKEESIFKFALDVETYFHAVMTRITGFTGCFSVISTYRLLNFIKKYKPDVIHIHELHAYFVNIKPLLAYIKKANIKTVCTLHCEFMYTGKCGHSINCTKWQSECRQCPHLREYPISLFFDHTRHMFMQKKELLENMENLIVVTPSLWLAERTKNSFLKNKDIHIIHNGIDTDVFYPQDTDALRKKHNIQNDEKVVLALAPNLMSENKGGKYVVQLAEKMLRHKVKFILIGVDEELETSEKNIIVLGRIYDRKLLAQYYSMADVFVICSERENFPTTCLEAQCCGTPVCGFDVGGVRETLIDDMGLCEFGNVEALYGIVCRALSEKTMLTGKVLSEKAIKRFGKSEMVQKYMNIYCESDVQ